VAEVVFYRLLFFTESPGTPWPANASEYTAFSVPYATRNGIDLTTGRLVKDQAQWTHLTDYVACQGLADAARSARIEIIRYMSVRDPRGGSNLALLTCRAFAQRKPSRQQTWHIRLSDVGAQAVCEWPKAGITFHWESFASDPRVAGFSGHPRRSSPNLSRRS
jgi:hypothetical protein